MFQFPTWRTGSTDGKGTKCLFGVVTTLWFLLPPPTLNLLPWSWTVWIRTVRAALWSVSREPLTCKRRGGAFAQPLQFPLLLDCGFFCVSHWWRFRCTRSWDSLPALPREEKQRCVGFFFTFCFILICYFLFQESFLLLTLLLTLRS